jgi:hypothetical protein
MQQRIAHGEDRTDDASLLLHEAERALQSLDADRAALKLAEAKEVLDHPDVELAPEGEMMRSQLQELTARVPGVREERARKEREAREEKARQELMAAVDTQRDGVVQAMEEVTLALEALEKKDAGRAEANAVLAAIKRVRERQQAGKALEARSEDYAASARNTARRLEQAEAKALLAQRVFDFASGPAQGNREAAELEKKARGERDLEAQLALYTDARERLRRCEEGAEKLLAESVELARRSILVEGRPTTLKAVATGCTAKASALERTVAKLEKAKGAKGKARAR